MGQQLRGKGKRFGQIHIGLQGKQRVLTEADGIIVALINRVPVIQRTADQVRESREADPIRKEAKEVFAAEQVFREQGGRRFGRVAGLFRQRGAREAEHDQQKHCAQHIQKAIHHGVCFLSIFACI